ncbi:MAG: hypothetical protein ACKV2O_06445 [Acidimicrobiales bacterium]
MTRPARASRHIVVLLSLSCGLVGLTAWWGRQLNAANPAMVGRGSPWYGNWEMGTIEPSQWHRLMPAVALGVVMVRWWPALCRSTPIRTLPWVTGLLGICWAATVQAINGWNSLNNGVSYQADYLRAVPAVQSPVSFLRAFVERADTYPVHVQAHPPGQVLLLWALDRVGLGGAWPATAQTLLFAALASGGVLTVLRWEAGEMAMRRAATFMSLTPAVLAVATSTDPTFSALAVLAVVGAFAAERQTTSAALLLGVGTGMVAAVACFFTYAAPLFLLPALVPLHRLWRARRPGPALAAAFGGTTIFALVAASGFWWWDGFQHTRVAYRSGIASERPYTYFMVANMAVLLVALGPAVLAAVAHRPLPRVAPLVLCAVAGVLFANFTGLSKGEVERIWLPFIPWIALAASALPNRMASDRRWLAAQLTLTVGLQLTFASPW